MAFKVNIDLEISPQLQKALKDASKPIDQATAKRVGIDVVKAMKAQILNGNSPIEGDGKFPAYKNPKKYPGKLKSRSPVNLKLSGKFLNALKADVENGTYGQSTTIYYSGKEQVKEQGHREEANRQPYRPTIPSEKNETFIKVIREIYLKLYQDRILDVLKGRG